LINPARCGQSTPGSYKHIAMIPLMLPFAKCTVWSTDEHQWLHL